MKQLTYEMIERGGKSGVEPGLTHGSTWFTKDQPGLTLDQNNEHWMNLSYPRINLD
jgi:hypothetical protein